MLDMHACTYFNSCLVDDEAVVADPARTTMDTQN